MSNLAHLFKIGQKVKFKNDSFDATENFIDCVVKEIFEDRMVITDISTNTDLHIERNFNLDCVYPNYNF